MTTEPVSVPAVRWTPNVVRGPKLGNHQAEVDTKVFIEVLYGLSGEYDLADDRSDEEQSDEPVSETQSDEQRIDPLISLMTSPVIIRSQNIEFIKEKFPLADKSTESDLWPSNVVQNISPAEPIIQQEPVLNSIAVILPDESGHKFSDVPANSSPIKVPKWVEDDVSVKEYSTNTVTSVASASSEAEPVKAETVEIDTINLDVNKNLEPTPAVHILSQISSSIPTMMSKVPEPISGQRPLPFESQAAPVEVKALRFKLQPEELGEVEVTLRRIGSELKVTINVAEKVAAESIGRDKNFLEDRLGVLIVSGPSPSVTITMEVRNPDHMSGLSSQSGTGQGSAEAALSGGRGFGRESRSAPHDTPRNSGRSDIDDESHAKKVDSGIGRIV
jgi:hypothetical protein